MKCKICKQKIEELFLEKFKGSYIKDENGKKHIICNNCQKKYRTKKEILAKIK